MSLDPDAQKYPGLSPYGYVANNPLRSTDPNGAGILDIVAGVIVGFAQSATPYTAQSIASYTGDQHDYAVGRVVGDAATMLIGGAEMMAGGTGSAGGVLASVTGVGALVGAPVTAASAALATVGAATTANATKKLIEDQNYLAKAEPKGGTYVLKDPNTGEVMKTGRSNDLDRRKGELGRNQSTEGMQFEVDKKTDSYPEQRGREQMIHAKFKPILDKINAISSKNPNRQKYLDAAKNLEENQ